MTYAIAIRRAIATDYQSPVIIIKSGLSIIEARKRAEELNKTHKPECVALGGDCFVAYNTASL